MLQDLIYAARTLRRSPLFLLVAVASLALGIGANTAIFSILNQALLRQLPVERPQELIQLDHEGPTRGFSANGQAWSYPMYRELREKTRSLAGLIAHFSTTFSLTEGGQTERVRGDIISANYFDVLGVRPLAGRVLRLADDESVPGGHPVVVLSHGYWMQRFGGSLDVLNRKVLVNGLPMTIIGIAERGFNGLDPANLVDVWAPVMMKRQLTPTWDGLDNRQTFWLHVYGRLNPGVGHETAKTELTALFRAQLPVELDQLTGATNERFRKRFLARNLLVLDASRGLAGLRKTLFQPLTALMAMVGLVLLIACANLANLMMARSASRAREIAIRLSLGASRARLIRQLLVESTVLGLLGGLAGLTVAAWTAEFLSASFSNATPKDMARFGQLMDWPVMAFNFGLSALTGLLFGLLPALQATRGDSTPALKEGTNRGPGSVRFRQGLIAAQVALAVVLLAGAGLFARSLHNLKSNDPGFKADSLVQFKVDAPLLNYNNARALDFYHRLQERLAAVPGVTRASMISCAVMEDCLQMRTVAVEGYQGKENENLNPLAMEVGPGYFATLGTPLLQGRDFNEADRLTAPKVAIVNQAFATYFFQNENPIGRRFRFGRSNVFDIEIVGVVKDAKHGNMREKQWRQVYLPYGQNDAQGEMTFYVRAGMDPAALGAVIRREVSRLDANMPVAEMRTLVSQIDRLITTERLVSGLATAFGVLATLLAAVGLYGVMAFIVARRTREIGIRMALGALRGRVLWLVMREVAVVTGAGIALGLPLALAAGRLVQSQLFGVESGDLLTLAGAAVVISLAAALAGFLPARRATTIDPINALRYE